VLDPRPETELLVEEGLKRLPPSGRVLDLGTGSGCILASVLAERGDASGVGVDLSPGALKIAGENAAALGVASRVRFLEGGWSASVEAELGPFDLVLSNPPYIPEADVASLAVDVRRYDPRIALTPGGDGLGAYRAILALIAKVGKLLKSGGSIGFEFGLGQEVAVPGMMAAARLRDIVVLSDLAGLPRAAFGRRA
jgi:release factor glutamine methyltransferase